VNCLCGCGTRLGRGQVGNNLVAGEVAIELVVWDKARTFGPPVASAEVAALVESGAPRYQGLLAAIHDDRELGEAELKSTREWLKRSRQARLELSGQLSVPKKKVSLSDEDQARINRLHPELTFSGGELGGGSGKAAAVSDSDLDALLSASTGEQYERLAVAWLGRLIAEQPPSLDELRWLLGRLEDVRSGRREEAEPALRRFLSERS
jgi:hypothetical protein